MSFGATPATSFTVNSATQITAVTPAHSAGTVLGHGHHRGRNEQRCRLHLRCGADTDCHLAERRSGGGRHDGRADRDKSDRCDGGEFRCYTGDVVHRELATQITAVAPVGSAGTVLVTVTTVGGTSNGVAYTYVAVPTLTTVVPNAGPVTGGTTVVLTGTNLTGATAVNFGGTPATSFTVGLVDADHRRRPRRVGGNGIGHGHHRGWHEQWGRVHLRRGTHADHGGRLMPVR